MRYWRTLCVPAIHSARESVTTPSRRWRRPPAEPEVPPGSRSRGVVPGPADGLEVDVVEGVLTAVVGP